MGEPSNPQDPSAPDSVSGTDDASFSQDDIDALMSGESKSEAGVNPAPASDESSSSESPEISQADIDVLMHASQEDEGQSDDAPPSLPKAQRESLRSPSEPQLDTMGRPFDEAAAAMQTAIEEEKKDGASGTPSPAPPLEDVKPLELSELSTMSPSNVDPKRVTMLNDVNLQVKIELGRTRMLVEEVLALEEGSVVELDKLAGDPVDVYVNERLVARGEVLVLNDNFCVRINEVLTHDPHRIIT